MLKTETPESKASDLDGSSEGEEFFAVSVCGCVDGLDLVFSWDYHVKNPFVYEYFDLLCFIVFFPCEVFGGNCLRVVLFFYIPCNV